MEMARTEPIATPATLLSYSVEMHLSASPELPKKYGKRIKAAGGTYGEARGYASVRTVVLPSTARGLINELFLKYAAEYAGPQARSVMIVRGLAERAPSWVTVQYIPVGTEDAVSVLEQKFLKAVAGARGRQHPIVFGPVTVGEKAQADRIEAETKEFETKKRLAEALHAAVTLADFVGAEGGTRKLAEVLSRHSGMSALLVKLVNEAEGL